MKDFLIRHNIPTGTFQSFTNAESAIAHIKSIGCPLVIKADGLAAGKGVTVALEEKEAIKAVQECLTGSVFGKAGEKLIVEEFLEGEEASFIVMTDGEIVIPFASSQDHKAPVPAVPVRSYPQSTVRGSDRLLWHERPQSRYLQGGPW